MLIINAITSTTQGNVRLLFLIWQCIMWYNVSDVLYLMMCIISILSDLMMYTLYLMMLTLTHCVWCCCIIYCCLISSIWPYKAHNFPKQAVSDQLYLTILTLSLCLICFSVWCIVFKDVYLIYCIWSKDAESDTLYLIYCFWSDTLDLMMLHLLHWWFHIWHIISALPRCVWCWCIYCIVSDLFYLILQQSCIWWC